MKLLTVGLPLKISSFWGGSFIKIFTKSLYMRLKSFFFLLFIIASCFLSAENIGEFLSSNLVSSLQELEIDSSSNLYLDIHFHETNELNRFILQEHLLNNGFSLVETEEFADFFVIIRVEESFIQRSRNRFPKTIEVIKESNILVQYTRKVDMQILTVKRHIFYQEHQEEDVVKSQWYTPYLIILVIGSLIYLLFYGN